MEDGKVRKNYLYNVIYQILIIIIPLITMPYLTRVLGGDGIGRVSYAESVTAYFVLFASMGITTFGQRGISYVRDSLEERSYVFWNTKALEVITSITALVLFAVFSLLQKDRTIYLLFAFNIISVLFDVTWFFQGMEEFGKIVLRNVIIKVLGLISIFAFVKQKSDIYKYVFVYTFFTTVGNISLWGYLPKYIRKVPFHTLRPFSDINTVLELFIPTVAIQVYTVLDKTMIGLITKNSFENGYYEQAIAISKMALAIVTALGTVMIPRIGYYYEKGNEEKLTESMYGSYRFVWFLGIPLCFGLIGVSGNFVGWFYGAEFGKVASLLKILAFLILAIGINNITGMQYLVPTKQQNTFTKTVIIGAVTNFLLNSILISFLQSTGAAIASVVAETVIAAVQLYCVRDKISPKRVVTSGWKSMIAGIVMLLAVLLEGRFLSPSIVHTAIMVISGGAVYFAALLLMKDEYFKSLITSRKAG